jgi:hypothetical protein
VKYFLITLLTLILSTACGPQEHKVDKRDNRINVDPRLKDLWDATIKFYKDNNVCCGIGDTAEINVVMVDKLKDNRAGECISSLGFLTIRILDYPLSDIQKMNLVLHEQGHCLFNLPHQERHNQIMTPYVLSEKVLKDNWDQINSDYLEQIRNVLK